MSNAKNGNISIYYETFGDKSRSEAVVLLSGAGSDHTLWKHQIDALKDDFYIVAVDNRGSGESDRPAGPYTAAQMAADVSAVVDAEHLRSVSLIGFSLGGLVAQKFVSLYPNRVKRLGLFNCSLGIANSDTVLPTREVLNMFLFFGALSTEDCCRNAVDYQYGRALEEEQPDMYRELFEYTYRNSLGMVEQLPILASKEKFIEDHEAVRVPVLVVMSNDDPVTPPANGEAFKRHLPHARIEYLDGYHASMVIHPSEVSALLRDFLSK